MPAMNTKIGIILCYEVRMHENTVFPIGEHQLEIVTAEGTTGTTGTQGKDFMVWFVKGHVHQSKLIGQL